jgi:beta-lactamase regulating signal transducer with metallopeptidase domain
MMPPVFAEAESLSKELIVRLIDGSLQGAIVIAVVWAVCAVCRSVPASVRTWLWWLACLKLVMALAALPAVPIPILPATPHGAARNAGERMVDTAAIALPMDTIRRLPQAVLPTSATQAARSRGWRWSVLLAVAFFAAWWMAAIALQALRLVIMHRRLTALVGRARPVDEHCRREATWLARLLELRRVPDVLVSDEVSSPQVVGFRRPRVLMPAAMTQFSEDDRRMMLCHELTHVRRRDLVLGWIPALAERTFFFHPLARFAAREYVLAREAACDATVLRALGAGPQEYGRLLVRLGVSRGELALTANGSSATMTMLKRRLEMLHVATSVPAGRRRLWMVAVTLALAAVPFQLTARASSLLPPAVASASPLPSGIEQDVTSDVAPRLWVVQLFNVVQDGWVEGQRIFGVPLATDSDESGALMAGARFGARRRASEEATAASVALDGDGQNDAVKSAEQVQDVVPVEELRRALEIAASQAGNAAWARQEAERALERVLEQQARFRELEEKLQPLREGDLDNALQPQLEALARLQQFQAEATARLQEAAKGQAPQGQESGRASERDRQLREMLEQVRKRIEDARLAAKLGEQRQTDTAALAQVEARKAEVDAARAELERVRSRLEEAQSRLKEAEARMVEALDRAARDARRGTAPAPK